MIPNSISILNSKGGVGKTSLSANLAGLAARDGLRTLLVDLDPQANLARQLGYRRRIENDKGQSLLASVLVDTETPKPLQARPNLRVVTAGLEATVDLSEMLALKVTRDPKALLLLQDALSRLIAKEPTDLVIFDNPPHVGAKLSDAALAASNYVLMPTKSDPNSLDGFETFGAQFARIRETVNPDLEVLGAVLFGVDAQRTRAVREVRAELEQQFDGTGIPVFNTVIRHSQSSAEDANRFGELAHEYGMNAHVRAKSQDGLSRTYSQAAEKLAFEYVDLYEEVMREMNSRASAQEPESEMTNG